MGPPTFDGNNSFPMQTRVRADALWEVSSTYPGISRADSKGRENTSALKRKVRVRGKT